MNLLSIKRYAIELPLIAIGLATPSGIDQVFYTGYLESKYQYVFQIKGPALSFFQIEPFTHLDVKKWLLRKKNALLLDKILKLINLPELPDDDYLVIDQRYAAIICRLIYFRNKAPMPSSKNATLISNLHKLVYNTKYGKANPELNAKIIQGLIDRGV